MKNQISKYLLFLIAITGSTLACSDWQSGAGESKALNIAADMDRLVVYEMDTVLLGSSTELMLKLTNTLQTPVIINEARVFCGCTRPEYKPEPILPGKSSKIKITYHADQLGTFDKAIRLFFNDQDSPVELRFRGEVVRDSR